MSSPSTESDSPSDSDYPSGPQTILPQHTNVNVYSSVHHTLIINGQAYPESAGNRLFEAAELYLGTKISPANTKRLQVVSKARNDIVLSLERDQEVDDTFEDVQLKWGYIGDVGLQRPYDRNNYFVLTFPKEHGDKVRHSYLPYVLQTADAIRLDQKVPKLYTHDDSSDRPYEDKYWGSMDLPQWAKLETMAMDPAVKRIFVDDLDMFVRRREFYKKMGRPWKRGYLLYGPPHTGKSGLIAAMANYLKFDVYKLGLSEIHRHSELKHILASTTNRSILVVEDKDCTGENKEREDQQENHHLHGRYSGQGKPIKYNLSGLLDYIHGLWTSIDDERIIVCVTNKNKNDLDPEVLRAGLMDVHVPTSYCTPAGFKVLALNYLGIDEDKPHPLCGEIEGLLESAQVAAADVAEELMKSDDADVALGGLLNSIKGKKIGGGAKKRKIWEYEESEQFSEDDSDYAGARARRRSKPPLRRR